MAGFRPQLREEMDGGEEPSRDVDLWRKRLHLTAVWGWEVIRHEIQTFQRGNRKRQDLLNLVLSPATKTYLRIIKKKKPYTLTSTPIQLDTSPVSI